MKRLKQSQLIHIWEEFEFYLNTPKSFKGSNKPFIFFYFLNPKTNKTERIRRYLGKNKGDIKKVQEEAKILVNELVNLLRNRWDPLDNSYIETSLTPNSNISACIDYWLKKRLEALQNNAIGSTALKNNKILMRHLRSYLGRTNLSSLRASGFSNVHIREFLDSIAAERNWGKVTYNVYLVDLGTFFNYLLNLKIINPCLKVQKKNTRSDSSRFKVFEKDELQKVANLLLKDKRYSGLYLAAKLLYKYNIRP